jgi:2-beta-glucuronyltransferase
MNILLLTGHFYSSKNKAGFHHIANALMMRGHKVYFCTCPNSFLTFLKNNDKKECLNIMKSAWQPFIHNGVYQTSYISLMHNYSRKYLLLDLKILSYFNLCIFQMGFCKIFGDIKFDIIIFESGVGLFLFNKLKKLNPNAKFIYRVSDDLEIYKANYELLKQEKNIVAKFDKISTPIENITIRLSSIDKKCNIKTQYHGINKQIFDKVELYYNNPYIKKRNLVFVGANLNKGFFDWEFLDIASNVCPEYNFHIIGQIDDIYNRPLKNNIFYYGKIPFAETVPYIYYADIGLHIFGNYAKNMAVFGKSLKFIQYTYNRLPIIAPKHLNLKDKHVYSYDYEEKSIFNAITSAMNHDRSQIDRKWIWDWRELVEDLIN